MRVQITCKDIYIDIEADRSDLAHPNDPMMEVGPDTACPDELAKLIIDVASPILFDVGLATGQIIKAGACAIKDKLPIKENE